MAVDHLVRHEAPDAHLRGPPVVELDRALLLLLLGGHLLPRLGEGVDAVGEVPGEGALRVLHVSDLEDEDEESYLEEPGGRDLGDRRQPVGHVGERDVLRGGEHAREADVLLGDVAEHGDHGDAAVLDLLVSELVEELLVLALQEAEGVPEAERRLHADLVLEAHLHGGRGGLGGGRQGGAVERAAGERCARRAREGGKPGRAEMGDGQGGSNSIWLMVISNVFLLNKGRQWSRNTETDQYRVYHFMRFWTTSCVRNGWKA